MKSRNLIQFHDLFIASGYINILPYILDTEKNLDHIRSQLKLNDKERKQGNIIFLRSDFFL